MFETRSLETERGVYVLPDRVCSDVMLNGSAFFCVFSWRIYGVSTAYLRRIYGVFMNKTYIYAVSTPYLRRIYGVSTILNDFQENQ